MPTPTEIREARLTVGLSQKAAAEIIGFARLSWIRFENGQSPMSEWLWRYWLHKVGLKRIPFTPYRRGW